MGIPKFFRWMSERYPLCSQLISETHIPEFDNLYLDMNGIIHSCSHPNDDNVHFRMSEEQIFLGIFNYIDQLFTKVKPKKLFFMAVDGVAPRAKMNQQRARRFRTAKDREDARKKAIAKGEVLPKDDPFDSNCITPGTDFMVKLSEQLKYFVHKKQTEDASWQGVQVVLSGHEVAGEGEHKIMEYLRLARSQPGYNSNVRHCLYGLDADLIMLGLLSHEPHFALLREEVKFGRSKKSGSTSNPETQNFYLLHLSLLREYLDLEFQSLRETLSFEYDLERIIDDFILMSFFIGNDFLPNLPRLHVNEGALTLMFKVYKKILPEVGGYLNNGGELDLGRCEAMLRELGEFERDTFAQEQGDEGWFRGKRRPRNDKNGSGANERGTKNGRKTISPNQKEMVGVIKSFVENRPSSRRLVFPSTLNARDRAFVTDVATQLNIKSGFLHQAEDSSSSDYDEDDFDEVGDEEDGVGPRLLTRKAPRSLYLELEEDDDESDEESLGARLRVLKRLDEVQVVDDMALAREGERLEKKKREDDFNEWKRLYYKEKLEIKYDQPDQLTEFIFKYTEGLQWVLYYYYNGVASWEWFFPYHYAPNITDLVNLQRFKFNFKLGTPFLPFQQLMGVLPAASGKLIPEAYRELMTDPNSPIHDFYPVDFDLDMNGKKADWEAVVKIPFIDEKRLLKALAARENQLTASEKKRNSFGNSYMFVFDPNAEKPYKSSLPGVFPEITNNMCTMEIFYLPVLGNDGLVKGLLPNARMGVHAMAGFPTLNTIPHIASLGFHAVNVFNQESANESMVITLQSKWDSYTVEGPQQPMKANSQSSLNGEDSGAPRVLVEKLAADILGKTMYIHWPFLTEAQIVGLSDDRCRFDIRNNIGGQKGGVVKTAHFLDGVNRFAKSSERIESQYSKRFGTLVGQVDVVVHVRPLKGMKLEEDGSLVKDFGGKNEEVDIALQTIVESVEYEDPRHEPKPPPPIEVEFPVGSTVFFLADPENYGVLAEVTGHKGNTLSIRIPRAKDKSKAGEPTVTRDIARKAEASEHYLPSFRVASALRMNRLVLSKVTSSLHVVSRKMDQRFNLGLNLKFDSKKKKVLGYTRKTDAGWEYSAKAVQLIEQYRNRFPDFFAGLERREKGDFYEDLDFYPEDTVNEKINEMKDFLKTAGVKDFEKVGIESKGLTKDYVVQIEAAMDNILASAPAVEYKVVANVPRRAVLKPAHARHRLSNQSFDLGERVVHVTDVGSVPLGAKGTIIAIDGHILDVIFDHTFLAGSNLDGRCTEFRGMNLTKSALLNLTNKQPPMEGLQPEGFQPTLPSARGPNKPYSMTRTGPQQAAPGSGGAQYGTSGGSNTPNAWTNNKAAGPKTAQRSGSGGGPSTPLKASLTAGSVAHKKGETGNDNVPTILRGPRTKEVLDSGMLESVRQEEAGRPRAQSLQSEDRLSFSQNKHKAQNRPQSQHGHHENRPQSQQDQHSLSTSAQQRTGWHENDQNSHEDAITKRRSIPTFPVWNGQTIQQTDPSGSLTAQLKQFLHISDVPQQHQPTPSNFPAQQYGNPGPVQQPPPLAYGQMGYGQQPMQQDPGYMMPPVQYPMMAPPAHHQMQSTMMHDGPMQGGPLPIHTMGGPIASHNDGLVHININTLMGRPVRDQGIQMHQQMQPHAPFVQNVHHDHFGRTAQQHVPPSDHQINMTNLSGGGHATGEEDDDGDEPNQGKNVAMQLLAMLNTGGQYSGAATPTTPQAAGKFVGNELAQLVSGRESANANRGRGSNPGFRSRGAGGRGRGSDGAGRGNGGGYREGGPEIIENDESRRAPRPNSRGYTESGNAEHDEQRGDGEPSGSPENTVDREEGQHSRGSGRGGGQGYRGRVRGGAGQYGYTQGYSGQRGGGAPRGSSSYREGH